MDFEDVRIFCAKYVAVPQTLAFLKTFVGTAYHRGEARPDLKRDEAPFYAVNGPVNVELVKKNGINCAGLANLARRFNGLPIPTEKFPGGTEAYFVHFTKQKLGGAIPAGALLLYDFNPDDGGHVAIVTKDARSVREVQVIDSRGDRDPNTNKVYGVTINTNTDRANKYTHYVDPVVWLGTGKSEIGD